MKLIKPYFEIIKQGSTEVDILKHIETCGRVSWKSEERTTDDSYIKFINMLKDVKHGSVLEHGTVYLSVIDKSYNVINIYNKYSENKYSKAMIHKCDEFTGECYITTNYRVLFENNWLDDLKYLSNPTQFHEKRITVRIICDRGVSHKAFVA